MNEQTGFSIDDLGESVGIPIRTIRFYVSQGLLPGPGARGKAATYSEEHLLRLRLIRRLVEQRLPLAEIRERLEGLTTTELRVLLADEDRRIATLERAAELSPKDYVAVLLDQSRVNRQPPVMPKSAFGQSSPLPGSRRVAPRGRNGYPGPDVWRRLELAPGVELHVRGDAEMQDAVLIDRIVDVARTLGSASPKDSS